MAQGWDMSALLKAARGDEPAEMVLTGAKVVGVLDGRVEEVDVAVSGGLVVGLGDYEGLERVDLHGLYLLPGFIEGHLHVESSLLAPAELARVISPRGTTAVVADPHEIANVMGLAGVRAMLAAGRDLPVSFFYNAPSCVPATHLEDAGAVLDAADLASLLGEPGLLGLAEVMNFPGVINGDPGLLAKIAAFAGRPIDGHAPLLGGRDLNAYLLAGPDSDHECTRLDEAQERLARGMWVMLRQGTSAHNLADLLGLVNPLTERRCLMVSDDRHPDTLANEGHMDDMLRRAVAGGLDPVLGLRLVTINPARRFGLARRGAIAPGWLADLVAVQDLRSFKARMVWQGGRLVAAEGRCLHACATPFPPGARQTMRPGPLSLDTFRLRAEGRRVRVMEMAPGQLITRGLVERTPQTQGWLAADQARDLARMSVIERHRASGLVGQGLVRGFGFMQGALASSVAHDSHNLAVVGLDERSMLTAAARVAEMGGGLAATLGDRVLGELPLPLAGLMSDQPLETVLAGLADLRAAAAQVCRLAEPFMALSFLSLPVIPELKLTNRGLVDVTAFAPVELFLP